MRTRSVLLAFAAALAALLMVTLPSTAAADVTSDMPADHYPTDAVNAAVELEYNEAVLGDPPPGMPCVSTTGAIACFEADGDKWWVKDTKADSASAEAFWENYLADGTFYRTGICRNSLGSGKWGVCNKDYYEDSFRQWSACVYDASEGVLIRCSPWFW